MEATKRPWHVEFADREGIAGRMILSGQTCVASVTNLRENAGHNANLIVRAVNSYEAHRKLADTVERVVAFIETRGLIHSVNDDYRALRQALSAVEEAKRLDPNPPAALTLEPTRG